MFFWEEADNNIDYEEFERNLKIENEEKKQNAIINKEKDGAQKISETKQENTETKLTTNENNMINNEEIEPIDEFNVISKDKEFTEEPKNSEIKVLIPQPKKPNYSNNKKIIFNTFKIGATPQDPNRHSREAPDNASKVFIRKCKSCIDQVFQAEIEEFLKKKNNSTNEELNELNINNYLNKGNQLIIALLKTHMKTLYENSLPRRIPNEYKNKKDEYCEKNKKYLNKILQLEENDEKIKIKELNMKFNAQFRIYLEAFLYDEKTVNINGIKFYLKDFETLKDCFNEGEDKFTEEKKIEVKKRIEKMMRDEIETRIKNPVEIK